MPSNSRNTSTKQPQIVEKRGYPQLSELVEKRLEMRYIDGKGLYLVYKRNNKIYTTLMTDGFA